MSSASVEHLASAIHGSGHGLMLLVTGGGATAISDLLRVPGASRSVVEAAIPYSAEALSEWLGAQPDSYCSERTARAMAMAAYRRGLLLRPGDVAMIGIGCTASLVSDRVKRGPHRVHVAGQSRGTTTVVSLEFEKGRRNRAEEERLAADLVLNMAAEFCGLGERLELELAAGEKLDRQSSAAPEAWQQLLAGEVAYVPLGAARQKSGVPAAVFPGAFNPLHVGHLEIAAKAAAILGCAVTFELSIENVDKPPLDYVEIERRVKQFTPDQNVWLTFASTFVEKAAIFPGTTFVVGADTIARIAAREYYGSEHGMLQAIDLIAAAGCRFLVFGRASDEGFLTIDDLELPQTLAQTCTQVPETEFRKDIASTHLRRPTGK